MDQTLEHTIAALGPDSRCRQSHYQLRLNYEEGYKCSEGRTEQAPSATLLSRLAGGERCAGHA
jgi:hypothetical protein